MISLKKKYFLVTQCLQKRVAACHQTLKKRRKKRECVVTGTEIGRTDITPVGETSLMLPGIRTFMMMVEGENRLLLLPYVQY